MKRINLFIGALKFYIATNIIAKIPSFRVRHWYYRNLLGYLIGKDSSVHMDVFVTGDKIIIGDNVVINRGIYLDGRIGIEIKNNVSISPEVYIVSLEHDPNDSTFCTRGGVVCIDDNVWIGARAIILPGVHIGEGVVVGAGSVVTKSIEPYQIVAGIPARIVGQRTREMNYRCRYFPWFNTDIQRNY